MTEDYDRGMLEALDRLVADYGPRPVVSLAALIRDPKRAEVLAAELEEAAARAPGGTPAGVSKTGSKGRRSERVGIMLLKELRLSDPEKHSLIAEIRRALLAGTLLPSMDSLRLFASMNELSIGKAKSRLAAIAPFLRSLSVLPTPEILSLRDSMLQSNDDEDRSLRRWREVIVGSRNRSNSSKEKVDDART